jgi:hypothetical protein
VSWPAIGGLNETLQLIQGDSPPVVPTILVRVEALDATKGVFSHAVGHIAPLREPTNGCGVVVARAERAAFLSERCQCGLDSLHVQIRQLGRSDPRGQSPSRTGQLTGGGIGRLDFRQGCAAEQSNYPAYSTERQ